MRKDTVMIQSLQRMVFYHPWPHREVSSPILDILWKHGLRIVTELGDELDSSKEMKQGSVSVGTERASVGGWSK